MRFRLEESDLDENLKSDKDNLINALTSSGFIIYRQYTSSNDNYIIAYSPRLHTDILIIIDRVNRRRRNNTKHLKNNVDSVNQNGDTYQQPVSVAGPNIGKSFIGTTKRETRFDYNSTYSVYILDSSHISINTILGRY